MWNRLKKILKLKITLVILTALTSTLIYAAVINTLNGTTNLYEFQPQAPVSSSQINHNFTELYNKITALETTLNETIPTGTVAAFFLTSCPARWIPADGGTHNGLSTPDLRGMFLRGLNNFGTGSLGIRSDGKQDPDGQRSLGAAQDDAFQKHGIKASYNPGGGGSGGKVLLAPGHFAALEDSLHYLVTASEFVAVGQYGIPRVAKETRPRNVALIFCVKE